MKLEVPLESIHNNSMKIKNTYDGALIHPSVAAEIEAILFDIASLREELLKLRQEFVGIKNSINNEDISPVHQS